MVKDMLLDNEGEEIAVLKLLTLMHRLNIRCADYV